MLRAARRAQRPEPAAAAELAAAVPALLRLAGREGPAAAARRWSLTVAAYASAPGEPPTGALLVGLAAAGATVLLPVLRADDDLDWAEHVGPLRPGRRGLPEPAGPLLGVQAVTGCDLVLVPALAAGRDGTRLGQGGGSYDRALARLPAAVPVVAVVWTREVLPTVPAEPHDRPVSAVLTPSGLSPVGSGAEARFPDEPERGGVRTPGEREHHRTLPTSRAAHRDQP